MSATLLAARRVAVRVLRPSSRASTSTPSNPVRQNESDNVKRARLLYQSRKRGTLENGLLLSSFAAHYLERMNAWELQQLDHLLNDPDSDWQLFYWISGREDAPPEFECEVLQLMRRHCQEQKHVHNQQPHITPHMVYIKSANMS